MMVIVGGSMGKKSSKGIQIRVCCVLSSVIVSGTYIMDHEKTVVDASSPCSTTAVCGIPLCRQFWKAGTYDVKSTPASKSQVGSNYLHIHPKFLHSNATSHKWAFGAIDELLDNAVDEVLLIFLLFLMKLYNHVNRRVKHSIHVNMTLKTTTIPVGIYEKFTSAFLKAVQDLKVGNGFSEGVVQNEHGHYINGLVLYTLDRLYKAVERLAKADGEWQWVRNDITLLGDACLETSDKLLVTSRLYKAYECLLPNTQKELTRRMNVEKLRRLAQDKLNGSSFW